MARQNQKASVEAPTPAPAATAQTGRFNEGTLHEFLTEMKAVSSKLYEPRLSKGGTLYQQVGAKLADGKSISIILSKALRTQLEDGSITADQLTSCDVWSEDVVDEDGVQHTNYSLSRPEGSSVVAEIDFTKQVAYKPIAKKVNAIPADLAAQMAAMLRPSTAAKVS